MMPGNTFPMGHDEYYPNGEPAELAAHTATVSDFALDKYEVTVGRFRQFVSAYDSWHKDPGTNPQLGDGMNPTVSSSNRDQTGWGKSWTLDSQDLPADSAELISRLKCSFYSQNWTEDAGTNEAYPINCVDWYTAFAFCIWDGGWLPTEAQWEYAAAGGMEERLYPWGAAEPDYDLANYASGGSPTGSDSTPVGSKLTTGGAGYFGHADLAGSVWEWVFDWHGSYPKSCSDYASTDSSSSTSRCIRGGGWDDPASDLQAAHRSSAYPWDCRPNLGFRCARTR